MSQAKNDSDVEPKQRYSVVRRLCCAIRGIIVAIREEWNFTIYAAVASVAIAGGLWLEVSRETWCLFLLCVTLIFFAEMMNSAIEHAARAITREQHPEIRDALDIASGGVLLTTFGTSLVVAIAILWPFAKELLKW